MNTAAIRGRKMRQKALKPLVKQGREIETTEPMSRRGFEARSAIAQAERCIMGQAKLNDTIEFLKRIIG